MMALKRCTKPAIQTLPFHKTTRMFRGEVYDDLDRASSAVTRYEFDEFMWAMEPFGDNSDQVEVEITRALKR